MLVPRFSWQAYRMLILLVVAQRETLVIYVGHV